ncbi:hypothetical protein OHA70_03390 [Kribbella sp. NBC_00382]|uniref:hypothetical protein n=1 Tax=Kribbella sp. NBC_00382 TaxID=2975967 RepID=UPI002E23DACD
MSDNFITLVDLAVSEEEAPARAARVRQWLLDRGSAQVNSQRDKLMHPSELAAGPQYRLADEDPEGHILTMSNCGIDLEVGRTVHHPMGNYTPPTCPECGSDADEDAHAALAEVWFSGPEPTLQCVVCGVVTPLGDWPGRWTFYVANFGVCFNNWNLRDEFIADLSPLVGTRVRVVRTHL